MKNYKYACRQNTKSLEKVAVYYEKRDFMEMMKKRHADGALDTMNYVSVCFNGDYIQAPYTFAEAINAYVTLNSRF